MACKITPLLWRIRAFFDRRYKSPITNKCKFGKQTIVFLGYPKRFSREIIQDGWLYQFDEYGKCRGMINMKIFERLGDA